MFKYLGKALSTDPDVSSKRLITFLTTVTVIAIAVTNLITGREVAQYIFDGLILIVLTGLGSVAVEAFSRKGISVIETTTEREQYTDEDNILI